MHKPTIVFRSPPATNPLNIMEVPSGRPVVNDLHLDALGHALQVGDTVQFADWMPVEVITALLPGGRFAHGDKTNFCCVVRLLEVGSYPLIVLNAHRGAA